MSYLEKALEVVNRIEKGKTKKMVEERKETLDMAMSTTILTFRDQIIASGKWKASPTTHAVEQEIDRLQREIMEGSGKLIDFRTACERWKKAGIK